MKKTIFSVFIIIFLSPLLLIMDFVFGIFFPYNRPAKPRNNTTFVVSSPSMVHQLIPQAQFKYDGADYQTNAIGFRDREYTREKPKDLIRIAVLGDSFIEGMGEEQKNTIPKIIENEINRISTKKVEVMNCGVRGGSPGHYKFWIYSLLDYQPDIFVICIFDNDIDDDASLLLKKAYYRANAYWNHSTPILRKSTIWSYLQGEFADLSFQLNRKKISRALFNEENFNRDKKRADGDLNAIGSNSVGYIYEPEKWKDHWARTKNNLDQIVNLLRPQHIPVLFVYIPGNENFPPVPQKLKNENSQFITSEFKRNYFSEWVDDWARENKIPFVNLNKLILDWYKNPKNSSLYQTTFHHFNVTGLREAAFWIIPELIQLLESKSIYYAR